MISHLDWPVQEKQSDGKNINVNVFFQNTELFILFFFSEQVSLSGLFLWIGFEN